jgi:mannose-1-phosphate guanylyltransferase/phosphomannomutase
MNAVIMAGGFGTRLRPLTSSLPKPMVPVAGKPLMQHVVELLVAHNLTRQLSLLFFQPNVISGYFGDGSKFGVTMKYRRADADYGTAGSVKNAEDLLDDRFLIVSGDVLTDFDLTSAIRFHEQKGALVTMVLTHMANPLAYGVVITDEDGRVTQFLEKPSWGEVISDTINTGIYILEREVLETLPARTFVDFSQHLFPRLLVERAPLYGYIAEGYWRDIGSPEEYVRAHGDIFAGAAHVQFPGTPSGDESARVYIDLGATIAADATLAGTVIVGPRARIESGAAIQDAVIGADCVIGSRSQLISTILWDRVRIGVEAGLREATVCNDVTIGDRCQIAEQTVISEKVTMGPDVQLRPNIRIWPGKEIEQGATVTDSLVWGDKFNRELFTDAKVSGIFNREFTPEFAVRLGGAWGAHLGTGKTILASRDDSPASRLLTRSVVAGLCAAGVSVHDLSAVPVPVVRHLLSVGMYAGGFHVRRSPDSADMSDLIVLDTRGRDLDNSEAKSIERLFKREDYYRADMDNTGRIEYPIRVLEGYRAAFMSALDGELLRSRGFRIVVDYQGGVGAGILAPIVNELGIETVTLEAGPKAHRFKRSGMLDAAPLSAVVRSLHCDLGAVIHAQAEKFALIDETGTTMDPIEMQRVIGYLFMSQYPGTTVGTPVVGSSALEDFAGRFGATVTRLRNDHQAMMQAHMNGVDLVLGTRGSLISGEFGPGADALFGIVYVLGLLARHGTSLSEVREEVTGYRYDTASAHCPWDKRGQVMRRLAEWARSQKAATLDGVRVVEDRGWIWVGPDRFKAQFNLVAESRAEEYVETRLTEMAGKVAVWQRE